MEAPMIKNGSGQIGPRKRFVGANWDPNFLVANWAPEFVLVANWAPGKRWCGKLGPQCFCPENCWLPGPNLPENGKLSPKNTIKSE